MLHAVIQRILPPIISLCELMGIFVVLVSAGQAFFLYCRGLVTRMEFKMAAEILKTVLVQELSELLTLGAVILLRGLLSLLIHVEMREDG